MGDEGAGRAQGDHHGAARQQHAAQGVQVGAVQAGHRVGIDQLAGMAGQQRGEFGFVRRQHVGHRQHLARALRIGRGGVEDRADAAGAGQPHRFQHAVDRRFELRQHDPRGGDGTGLAGDVARGERAVGARADDDGVAAVGIDVDPGGAGGLVAGLRAQFDPGARGQVARQLAAGILAQGADEQGARAAAGAGRGLVEALAPGTGRVVADQGLALPGQGLAVPDVVDVEGADHHHLCRCGGGHGTLRGGLRRRGW